VALKQRLSHLRSRIQETLEEAQTAALTRTRPAVPTAPGEEPPVVARLMVEIRSDGSQTIARGAIEDIASGEKVAVEARGTTPAQLVGSLMKTMLTAPLFAKAAVRAVLDGRRAATKDPLRGDE
jgi:hypothetical protein